MSFYFLGWDYDRVLNYTNVTIIGYFLIYKRMWVGPALK